MAGHPFCHELDVGLKQPGFKADSFSVQIHFRLSLLNPGTEPLDDASLFLGM